jgi:hypothetical protein
MYQLNRNLQKRCKAYWLKVKQLVKYEKVTTVHAYILMIILALGIVDKGSFAM